jgi:sarcosine oxidase subunit beta
VTSATPASADVAIIGGGIVGCATAYYLAAGGVDTVLLERSALNREASGVNAGSLHFQIYIHSGFPPDWIERVRPSVAMLREAAKSWASIEDLLGADCGVRLGGGMWIAETDSEMALIATKVKVENSMGMASEQMSRRDLLSVAPYLGSSVVGGSFLHGEGLANPLLVTGAFARAAQASGARFMTEAPVQAIERHAGGGFLLRTGHGPLRVGHVIAAAGAWTPGIARMVGLEMPIRTVVGQVNVTEPRPAIMRDQLLQHVGGGLTLKQTPRGAFIIGGGWPATYDRTTRRKIASHDSIVGNAWRAAKAVPEVAKAKLVRSWAGIGSYTDDALPIIGGSSVVEDFHVVFYPAVGFAMGPIAAQTFSEQFLSGSSSVPLEAFSPDRFL